MIKLSERGLNYLQSQEGYRQFPYDDHNGHWLRFGQKPVGKATIGYGHVMSSDELLDKTFFTHGWNKETANAVMQIQLRHYIDCVQESVIVPINQNQADALISFAYNIGTDKIKGFPSTSVLKYLNKGDYTAAAHAFFLWERAGSQAHCLHNRRQFESDLFKKPV